MTATWYLVKHVSDLFRNEPRNVGVVITNGRGWAAQFIGQADDGSIDGRSARAASAATANYKAWVEYVQRMASEGTIDSAVEKIGKRRSSNYLIERRGRLLEDLPEATSLEDVAAELFARLVDDHAKHLNVDKRAKRALKLLDIPEGALDENFTFEAYRKDVPHTVRFPYRYSNGRVTLLDTITLSTSGNLMQRVNDLLFRVDLAEANKQASRFIVFYGLHSDTSAVERQLERIEAYANTLDIEQEDAPAELAAMLHVPLRKRMLPGIGIWPRVELE